MNENEWKVVFEDGYERIMRESEIQNILVLKGTETMQGKQLDYIMISRRWLSSVKDSNVRWGPSEHRNLYGRADHALVDCDMHWRVRSPKPTLKKDFSVLFDDRTPQGEDESYRAKFESALKDKKQELQDRCANGTNGR